MLLFKTCSDCREFLANNMYYTRKQANKSGETIYLDNKCRKCRNEYNKAASRLKHQYGPIGNRSAS